MSSIQFSYPQMNGTIDSNKKIVLTAPGGSYFDLTYTSDSKITVLHFIPTEVYFIDGNVDYIIIYHIGTAGSTLAIRFKITQLKNAKHEITEKNVYINQLIGDGLEAKNVSFNGKTVKIGKDTSKADYTIDFREIGEIPIKTIKAGLKSTGSFPSYGLIKDSSDKEISINLTSNTFITDEIVCNEGIANSTEIESSSYEKKVSGNIGISFGAGFLFLTIIFWAITTNRNRFLISGPFELFKVTAPAGNLPGVPAGEVGDWGGYYMVFFVIAFLISVSCFIAYGVRMKKGPTDTKDEYVSSLLASAIIFFLMFIFMVGYKMLALTV